MAVSYRGKEVDMVSLAKKYEKNVALGNAHMNGHGDILGKGGKIVKPRVKEVEKEVTAVQEEFLTKAKPRAKKPVYEDITDEEKARIDELKAE